MIIRVRRYSGFSGGSNHYHHADIICENRREALRACKEGRVRNWRWVDSFDKCYIDYLEYEILSAVEKNQAVRPEAPTSKK